MATQLILYNQALRLCGERPIAGLTEDREPRHLLDQVWAEEGVRHCLEEGQWNFAMRAVQIDYDPAADPFFGYQFAFSKPTDWIRTAGVCQDESMSVPLLDYRDEVDYWYANLSVLFVRYVSNDAAFGQDLSRWPSTFSNYAAAHFAHEIIFKITTDKERVEQVRSEMRRRKKDALNKDAMNDPTTFPAKGSWVRARGSPGWRRDGGNRGNLIG